MASGDQSVWFVDSVLSVKRQLQSAFCVVIVFSVIDALLSGYFPNNSVPLVLFSYYFFYLFYFLTKLGRLLWLSALLEAGWVGWGLWTADLILCVLFWNELCVRGGLSLPPFELLASQKTKAQKHFPAINISLLWIWFFILRNRNPQNSPHASVMLGHCCSFL